MVCRNHIRYIPRTENLKVPLMEIDYRALLVLTGCRYDTIVAVNNLPVQGEMKNEMTIISWHSMTWIISV